MRTREIRRDQSYTLFELADRAGIRVAEVQDLVHRGQLKSHYTDDTEMINGQDFLKWAEQHDGQDQRHYQ